MKEKGLAVSCNKHITGIRRGFITHGSAVIKCGSAAYFKGCVPGWV